MASWTQG